MSKTRLNLQDFPDSRYAHELRRGGLELRFAPDLEAEYIAAHLQRVRLRARVFFVFTTVLAVLLTIDKPWQTGLWSAGALIQMGALMPCTIALAGLTWSRYYERLYMPTARVLVPIVGALIAVYVALGMAKGQGEQLAALTVILIGVFFFAGLLFRGALPACVIIVIVFATAASNLDLPHDILLKSILGLISTSAIGAFAFRDVERSYRRGFLESGLIGELVARDALCGLMNRRAFDEHLLRVWQHALRDRRPLALLMIDIDHFKKYNDTYGHQAGDEALRSVAQAIQNFARRPLDLAARYGGEEFAVILYDLPNEHVRDLAERIRHRVQNLRMLPGEAETAPEAGLTVSIGLSCIAPTIDRTPEGAVQLADEALYEAKDAGRNCVVVKGAEDYQLLDTGRFRGRASDPDRDRSAL